MTYEQITTETDGRVGIIRLNRPEKLNAWTSVMDRELQGHSYVKSAIDVACWDILGRAARLPVHQLLGGRQQQSLAMYGSVSQNTPEWMAEMADQWRAKGYAHIQVKVGDEPMEDVERLRAVAAGSPPGEILLADANRGWRRDEALRFIVTVNGDDEAAELESEVERLRQSGELADIIQRMGLD